jgi:hypothetical protein
MPRPAAGALMQVKLRRRAKGLIWRPEGDYRA